MTTFAQRLKYALTQKNMKQSVLAYKTKIDKSFISSYLSGRCLPRPEKIKLMAAALGVSEAWLAGYAADADATPRGVQIPVLGRVAAGIPIDAITDIIDYEEIDREWMRDGSEFFGLQIKGDSMEPRIVDGDVVIVRRQTDCESGQIAIVLVDGEEATCKRVMKQAGGILLQPLNPAYPPVFYTAEDIENLPVSIIGVVAELRGKF